MALKPGDEVSTVTERSPDFAFIVADAANVLLASSSNVTVSFARADPRDITNIAVVQSAMSDGAIAITQKAMTARPVLIEECQVRLIPEVAVDMAIAALVNVANAFPDMVRQKVRASEPMMKIISSLQNGD